MVGERGKTPVHEKQKQVKFLKGLAPPLMAAVVALSPICNTPGNPPICFHCSNALVFSFQITHNAIRVTVIFICHILLLGCYAGFILCSETKAWGLSNWVFSVQILVGFFLPGFSNPIWEIEESVYCHEP